ncbi:MAG: formylglycine-generating enzyme family protein [Burkholderiales bacterium]|nr:formylglycine-generating enzyme family protein [Burkholderiales bacterium]
MLPGFWFYLPVSADTLKPDWATDAGRDQFGLYADAEIVGVIQRFRWIEPNSFRMGSPEDEAGRYDNETQHQVNLTQGYWLADTACTKELWEAVKQLNPNIFFEGKKQPIENISWNDVMHFFDQIEEKHPELKLRLPTEAEWENACRAGTETAFHFGSDITLDQVNYRGIWKYETDKWGEGVLKKTTEVKSYPPSAWGLYEMHGNVYEWCQDWYGEYPSEPVIDPQGPDTGNYRVLRGGSWFNNGRNCRSALRDFLDPSYRLNYTGFRLVRGHALKPVRVLGRVQ